MHGVNNRSSGILMPPSGEVINIGVVGLNGSKSTLLQLMLKQLEPDSGSVDHGTKLEVAYFDH